jgi:hypothetical protein
MSVLALVYFIQYTYGLKLSQSTMLKPSQTPPTRDKFIQPALQYVSAVSQSTPPEG